MAKRQIKRPEPKTYEEHLERQHEQFKTLGRGHTIPPSNYPFKVGEKVSYGRLEECQVEELLEDGRLIHISHHDRGEIRGEPYDNMRRLPMLIWWTDLDPLDTIEETKFAHPRLRANYMQHDLYSLMHRAYSRGLIDSPEYQRGYVWSITDKRRLIQSIFNQSDIGKFIFLEHRYPENRLEVVDGKQRLRAIMDFYEGRFTYEGKTWFQLSWADKRDFLHLMIQSADLDSEFVKKSDILWLFLSINTAGVPQTEEHVALAQQMYAKAIEEEKVNATDQEKVTA